jgi:hypothetical protein
VWCDLSLYLAQAIEHPDNFRTGSTEQIELETNSGAARGSKHARDMSVRPIRSATGTDIRHVSISHKCFQTVVPSSSCVREFGSSSKSFCTKLEMPISNPRVESRSKTPMTTVCDEIRSAVCRATTDALMSVYLYTRSNLPTCPISVPLSQSDDVIWSK